MILFRSFAVSDSEFGKPKSDGILLAGSRKPFDLPLMASHSPKILRPVSSDYCSFVISPRNTLPLQLLITIESDKRRLCGTSAGCQRIGGPVSTRRTGTIAYFLKFLNQCFSLWMCSVNSKINVATSRRATFDSFSNWQIRSNIPSFAGGPSLKEPAVSRR